MNRKKKINQIYQSRAKKINAKLTTKNKAKYICKADRAQLEAAANQDQHSIPESAS